MLKKLVPQNFNDFLCLVLILLITLLWVLQGCKTLELAPEITGALIVTWTLLVQYYFRKKSNQP
jgi:hypothetical protein